METILEMTVGLRHHPGVARRIRLLKLLRIALIICLFMSWTYAIAVAAAFYLEGSGAATLWILQYVIYTIPATALLAVSWIGVRRLSRSYDYALEADSLEIWDGASANRRKLVAEVNCFSIASLEPEDEAPSHQGRTIRATVGKQNVWALDVRHEGLTVRVWFQPNEAFVRKLKTYVK